MSFCLLLLLLLLLSTTNLTAIREGDAGSTLQPVGVMRTMMSSEGAAGNDNNDDDDDDDEELRAARQLEQLFAARITRGTTCFDCCAN